MVCVQAMEYVKKTNEIRRSNFEKHQTLLMIVAFLQSELSIDTENEKNFSTITSVFREFKQIITTNNTSLKSKNNKTHAIIHQLIRYCTLLM